MSQRKRIWGWFFYDWACQPFYTLMLTFFFAPYFATVAADFFISSGMETEASKAKAQTMWSICLSASGLFIGISAPILGAIAGITNRVSIGTSVLLPTLRNPGHLLQTVNTVNSISGGRLILGLGMGGAFNDAQKQEWTNAGIDYRTRRARFEEILQIIDLSRNNDYVNFEGQYYKLSGMGLVQRSKIDYKVIIAAHARHKLNKQFARAARYGDGFISKLEFKKRRSKRKVKPFNNQTPWQELSRLTVGQLEDGACIKTRSKYTNIVEKKGTPRHSH